MAELQPQPQSSPQQLEEELKRLQLEKQDCLERAKQVGKDHDRTWKQEILILAQIMEKELKLLNQEWLLSDISEEISKLYKQNQIKIWPYVYQYLPSRFKQNNKKGLKDSTSNLQGESPQLLEQLSNVRQNVTELPPHLVAEVHNLTRQITQRCETRAELEHIALYNNAANRTHHIQVTIDKPKAHGSLTYEELKLVIEDLTQVKDRVFEFPPEILQKDQEIAAGWRIWRSWMKPSLDLKYSKSWLDWFQTEKYRDIYGKHAAAVMSFSLTNLCASCSDEKTKEWVRMEPLYTNSYATYQCLQCQYQIDTVCPSCNLAMKAVEKQPIGWQCSECEGTVPMSRDLTREQVGDKSSIIIDAALQILDHIPSQVAFCNWYKDWIEPRIGGRKVRLKDRLSNEA